jgi:UDP-N-acetylglucosamine acyltransferase
MALDWIKCHDYGSARIGKIRHICSSPAAIPDLKFGGEESLAIIGNNCTIRECVTRGTIASGQTVIETLIMASA